MAHTGLVILMASAVLAWLAVGSGSAARSAAAGTLVVHAGEHARANVPMSIELPQPAARATLLDDAGAPLPCQVADGRLWWVLDKLAAGKARTYTVAPVAAAPAGGQGVELKTSRSNIEITIDAKPFATYHFTRKLDWGGEIRRPCFFPVFAPGQVQIMRPYPLVKTPPKGTTTDHRHHTGLYVAHGRVNGTDNWSVGRRAGRQVHRRFELTASGPVVGIFREVLDWTGPDTGPDAGPGKKPVVAETRTVRVYRLGEGVRMMDLEVRFQAKYGQVTFGDTKEGGLCATRMRDEMRADRGGKLTNSEGRSGGRVWGRRARYVCCSGTLDGKEVGYALFDAPGNLRYPTYWHARTYGLVTANPFGIRHFDRKSGQRGDWVLQAGKERTFRYRICFYADTPKAARIAQRHTDYADPPQAAWE